MYDGVYTFPFQLSAALSASKLKKYQVITFSKVDLVSYCQEDIKDPNDPPPITSMLYLSEYDLVDPQPGKRWMGNIPKPYSVAANSVRPPVASAPRVTYDWAGFVSQDSEPVEMVQCDSKHCGSTVSRYFVDECVVMTAIKRFWRGHASYSRQAESKIGAQELPDYDDKILTRINRWVPKESPDARRAALAEMDVFKRRFILYYWFATDFFGAGYTHVAKQDLCESSVCHLTVCAFLFRPNVFVVSACAFRSVWWRQSGPNTPTPKA